MNIVQVLVILVVIGIVLWLITFIPMDATIKRIITIIVIALVVLWLIVSVLLPMAGMGGARLR
jgi:hypothetical protein